MRKHARHAPSAWERWSKCPGSITFVEALGIGETSSVYADEGVAAHGAAAWCLQMGLDAADVIGEVFDGVEEFPVTEEMARNVQVYLDYVRRQPGELHVEQRLHITPIDDAGTSDAVLTRPEELTVIDLKYGMGVKKFAEGNGQLMLYANGALSLAPQQPNRVRLVIVQPRLDHIDEWVCSFNDLQAFSVQAKVDVQATLAPDAPRVPGEEQCRFCPAKARCPELAAEAMRHATDLPADAFTNEQVAEALPRLGMIESWIEAVRTLAHAELMAGRDVPGYKLVAGRAGPRRWTDPKAAEEMLRAFRIPVDFMYDRTVISPTTAEKLVETKGPNGKPLLGERQWPKLAPLINRSPPKPTVVPASDKRDAIVVSPVIDQIPDLGAMPTEPAATPASTTDQTPADAEFADLV